MELSFLRAIQQFASPLLDGFFQLLTLFGEPAAMVLLFTILYWTVNKEQGEELAWAMAVSLLCNNILKAWLRAPRPIGQPGVRSLRVETATGYSFPSGHTQGAATLYGSLALTANRRVWKVCCAALMLLVGFSRLYLGVHYPKDVLAGLALGLLAAWAMRSLRRLAPRPVLLYAISAAVLLPFLLLYGGHDLYAAAGCMAGFVPAAAFERRFVGFTTEVGAVAKICRWGAGALLLGLLAFALKRLLPAADPWTLLRYALLVFSGMALYPWLFTAFERWRWVKRTFSSAKPSGGDQDDGTI